MITILNFTNRCGDCSVVKDSCGVCGGNGSTCAGCDGIPYSGFVLDNCGKCLLPSDSQFNIGNLVKYQSNLSWWFTFNFKVR